MICVLSICSHNACYANDLKFDLMKVQIEKESVTVHSYSLLMQ